MTFGALALGNRRMLGLRSLLTRQCVGVTLTAYDEHRIFQEAFFRGGVRCVAVDAALVVDDGPVDPRSC